ncbi:MAG TPA: sigma-70 family RNA polymerase sigma factor [Ignavibacteria bacterium]|mgnify:CR=1 FL=1|nr:sigma-70 family RNA polymerase sigma factor [Ignavibacteria bacterium]
MAKNIRILFLNNSHLLGMLLDENEEHDVDWKEFLRRFSNLILKVIWQLEKDKDEVMNKYLVVCTKLAENKFSILRKYIENHTQKSPKFTTWLVVVVRNICIDEHRAMHGRKRFPKALLALSELDRKVFELYFWKGYSEEEIGNIINKNDKTILISESIALIEKSLKRSRDYIYNNNSPVKTIRYDDEKLYAEYEERNDSNESEKLLEKWLSELNETERLIIRLKFWEDLSVKEIAGILKTLSEQKIYSIIRKAFETLREKKC